MPHPVTASHVWETSSSSGTGAVALEGTPSGEPVQKFVDAGLAGEEVFYHIVHTDGSLNEWEEGIGQVTDGSPDTLSRDTVLSSSNSGSLTSFSTGGLNVFVGPVSGRTVGIVELREDTSANRPTAGTEGRLFFESDTGKILYDTGSSWVALGVSDHSSLSGVTSDDHHSRYTDEEAQDAINTLLSGGSNIALTYDDANNNLTIDVSPQGPTSSLNADTVDGEHASAFADAGHSHAHSEITNVGSSDHHSRYSDSEAVSAVEAVSVLTPNDVDVGNNFFRVNGAEGTEYEIRAGQNISSGVAIRATSNPADALFGIESSGGATRFGVTQGDGCWARDGFFVGTQDDGVGVQNLNKVWHQGNDGGGSGLNADMVDGEHASAFADSGHSHSHSEITNVGSSDHHAKYTDAEARSAIESGEVSHINLANNESGSFGNDGELWHDASAGLYHYSSNNGGTNLVWDNGNVSAGNQISISTASEGHPTIAVNENNLDADTVDGSHASDLGGRWELISEVTISSNVQTVDFTGLGDSSYRRFVFHVQHLTPWGSSRRLMFRLSSDGGSTFDSGSSDYTYSADDVDSGGATENQIYSTGSDHIRLTADTILEEDLYPGQGYSGTVVVPAPYNTGKTQVFAQGTYQHDDTPIIYTSRASGMMNTAKAHDAARFDIFSSVEFGSGSIALYGVK